MKSKTNSTLINNLETNMSLIFKVISGPCWGKYVIANWRL